MLFRDSRRNLVTRSSEFSVCRTSLLRPALKGRRMRIMGCFFVLLFAASVGCGSLGRTQQEPDAPRSVEVTELVLRGSDRVIRARLGLDEDGSVSLTMFGPGGHSSISVGVCSEHEEPPTRVSSAVRAEAERWAGARPELSIRDGAGILRLSLGAGQQGQALRILDSRGVARIVVTDMWGVNSGVYLSNLDGRHIVSLVAGQSGGGVVVRDSEGTCVFSTK
jgi:hypothetical protein